MFPNSPYAHPVGSFQQPVSPPVVDPDQAPLIYVGFNQHWLSYILGALKQLLLQSTWKVNSDSDLNTAQGQAFTLLYLFSEYIDSAPKLGSAGADSEDIMIRQDPGNPCLLQTSINGVDWCTFADISKCIPAIGQTGAGAPQPSGGGGTQNYCQELTANAKLLLPTIVNSGDTIHLVSQSGAGNDGDIVTWYCPDGSYFFAGACIPGTHDTDSDDPMPSENHMSLIALIGGTYYSLEHGAITVPGGITNETVTIQINDDNLTNNSGSYQICVNRTNNATTNWSHTFDFTVSTNGFTATTPGDGSQGIWQPGQGWVSAQSITFPDHWSIWFQRTFTASSITSIAITYTVTGTWGTDFSDSVVVYLSGTEVTRNHVDTSAGTHTASLSVSSSIDEILVALGGAHTPNPSVVVTSMSVVGTGSDPF